MSESSGETRAAFLTWVFAAGALLGFGPIVGLLLDRVRTETGLPHATVLTADAPLLAGFVAILGVALSIGLGEVCRRVLSRRYAVFIAGLVLTWYAANSANLRELMRAFEPAGLLVGFGVEAGALGVLGVAAAWVLTRKRTGRRPAHLPYEPETAGLVSIETVYAVPLAGAGALAAAYLLAVTGLQGQTLAAGIGAGFAAGMLCRLLVPRSGTPGVVLGVVAAGIAGPIVGSTLLRSDGLAAIYGGELFPPAWLGPGDWLAGGMVGVPVGQYAALSLLDRSKEKAEGVSAERGRASVKAGRAA